MCALPGYRHLFDVWGYAWVGLLPLAFYTNSLGGCPCAEWLPRHSRGIRGCFISWRNSRAYCAVSTLGLAPPPLPDTGQLARADSAGWLEVHGGRPVILPYNDGKLPAPPSGSAPIR